MTDFDITHYRIKSDISEPLRACVLSDVHGEYHREIFDLIREFGTDLILIPGDITKGHNDTAPGAGKFFRFCTEICPTFFSIGNHENNSLSYVLKAAEKACVTVLDNSSVEFRGLLIGGLTSGYMNFEGYQGHWRKTPAPDINWLVDYSNMPGFKLLLSHHPEYYPEYIRDTGIDLTVSGHAHGGQWRIFGQPLFAPGQLFFPEYAQGLCDGRLIVSRGMANNGPVPRFFNNREIIFIDFV